MKKRAFRRRQTNVKSILVEKNGTSKLLRFVDTDTAETWNAGVGSTLFITLPDSLTGHIYIQAKCDKTNYSKVEIVANLSPQSDNVDFTYFSIWDGNRALATTPFMPTSDENDFVIDSDVIDDIQNDIATLQSDMSSAQSDITNKIDKVTGQNGKIPKLNTAGNIEATSIDETTITNKIDKVTGQNGKIPKLNTAGNIEATSIDETTITNKIDKVTGQNGKIPKLNTSGNIEATTLDETHLIPTGLIMINPMEEIPEGWLDCNGQVISRTTYANLFSAIGTLYGAGDGSTTFKIPDLRGLFVRGVDAGAGVDPDASIRTDRGDGATGDRVGTKQADELKSHNHQINIKGQSTSTGNMPACTNNAQDSGNFNSVNTGGNETRPKNIAMIFVIKT